MSLKELFQDTQNNQNLTQQDVEKEVQSEDYLNEFIDKNNEFIPQVDFSKPENFAFFGSAEKYYTDAFDRIINLYPYDGSKSEKLKWRNESTLLDRWVYDNQYPKSTGYAILSAEGWGTLVGSKVAGYGLPATQEYIYVKGGPNTGSSTITTLQDAFNTANILDVTNKQTSNLLFDLASSDGGITVEFWLNKQAFDNTKTEKEVIFDLWNGESSSSSGYGRFTIQITSSGNPFLVTAQSGTSGVFNASVGSSISNAYVLDGWHHYAFSVYNNSSEIGINFYTDGELSEQISTGTSINEVTGTLSAYVGALRTAVSGTATASGWGKLSGSIDEFRFWKTKRTSKDIGRNWWTNVDGGSNTDDYGVYLGIYYKFNEGIVGTTSRDQIVIDYSGRTTNGYWYGYTTSSRSTGSAFTAYTSGSFVENEDPILYSSHPSYTSTLAALQATGSLHDYQNNSKLYSFFPSWVVDNDIQHGEELSKLTQIAASYFDTLYLQVQSLTEIKNNFATIKRTEGVLDGTNELNSITGTLPTYDKPIPFAKTLVESSGFIAPEIFTDVTLLESLLSRNENIKYDDTIDDIKNTIYFNIYSTLINAFKTKGTKRSYNNILHSFGIDEKLVKINTYPTNTTFYFDDNTNLISQKRKVVDFNNSDRYMGTVHQYYDATNPNSVSYITGSIINSSFTVECEALFPNKVLNDPLTSRAFFTEASIFGGHTAKSNTDLAWATNDYFNFVVKSHRPNLESQDAYFELSSSVFGSLTSSLFYDVYSSEKWNFAVKVSPTKYENIDLVSGADGTYTVEFYGVNVVSNAIQNIFTVTGTLSNTDGDRFVTSDKRLFVGAHYTDFTSSVLQYSDTKVSYLRYWNTELPSDSILQHAFDTYNYGIERPTNSAFLNTTNSVVPEIETLTLEWSFNQITGSDNSGQFIVQDMTSGSLTQNKGYPTWFNDISKYQYTGRGFEFPENNAQVVDIEYFATEKLKTPETINSSDMINILTEDDEAFTADSRPEVYITRFEKSMYQNISEEMLNMFGTLVEFNNYVGRPIHKYRTEYKDLRYLRELFFSKVQNEPDLDRYLELYKWFDTSIGVFLAQLTPTTAQVTTKLENTIESHILERQKYQHKYLAINSKVSDPEDSASGINRHLYNWKVGHHPVSNSEQENALYWKELYPKTGTRTGIYSAAAQVFNRNQSVPYHFSVEKLTTFKGGTNFESNKKLDIVKIITAPHGALDSDDMIQPPANYLFVGVQNTSSLLKVEDVLNPNKKRKYSFGAVSGKDYNPSSRGYTELFDSTIAVPANFISGTVVGGYQDIVKDLFISGVVITNIHNDTYGDSGEIPMQGPFTNQWVGGNQSRHVDLNTGNDTYLTRPEAWKLLLGLGIGTGSTLVGTDGYQAALGFVGADYPYPEGNDFEPSYPVVAHKRATYLREETAKRPVNIKNIQTVVGQAKRIGNYRNNYEVIHTFGRTTNNSELLDAVTPTTETELSGVLRTNTTDGRVDFELPTRQQNKTVIGNKFSAPGGSRYSSRGYLNRYAEELSPYNAMSFRNREVIGSPHGNGGTPTAEVVSGGIGTGSLIGLSLTSFNGYVSGTTIPSFHKINKNPVYSVAEGTEVLEADYDNGYIQHTVPQIDAGYSWIRSSLKNGAISGNLAYIGHNMGYSVPSGSSSTTQTYTFSESGSMGKNLNEYGEFFLAPQVYSSFVPTDFIGLNTSIRDNLYGSGYPKVLGSITGSTEVITYAGQYCVYNYDVEAEFCYDIYDTSYIFNDLSHYLYGGINYNNFDFLGIKGANLFPYSFSSTIDHEVISYDSYKKDVITNLDNSKLFIFVSQYLTSNQSNITGSRAYVFEYDLLGFDNPYNTDSVSSLIRSSSINIVTSSSPFASANNPVNSFCFDSSGSYVYIFDCLNMNINQIPLSESWNLSSFDYITPPDSALIIPSYSSSISIATEITGNIDTVGRSAVRMKWKPDGSKLFIGVEQKVLEYSLSEPWQITSSVFLGSLNRPFSGSLISQQLHNDFEFSPDGKYLYFPSGSNLNPDFNGASINKFTLDNNWTLYNHTGSYDTIIDVSGDGIRTALKGVFINNFKQLLYINLSQEIAVYNTVISGLQESASYVLNNILLNRNGPYGYPSFKQIRGGETKAIRDSRRNSYITNTKQVVSENIAQDVTNYYKEPSINYNKPVVSIIKDTVTNSLVFLKHTQDNNIINFSNKELNFELGLKNKKDEPQTLDQIIQLLSDPSNTRYKLKKTVYTEQIYPKIENSSLLDTRIRTTFSFPYKEERTNRNTYESSITFNLESNLTNSTPTLYDFNQIQKSSTAIVPYISADINSEYRATIKYDDGNQLYILAAVGGARAGSGGRIFQYQLLSPWDINSIKQEQIIKTASSFAASSYIVGGSPVTRSVSYNDFYISPNGDNIFFCTQYFSSSTSLNQPLNVSSSNIYGYSLSTPWDVSSTITKQPNNPSITGTLPIFNARRNPSAITFKPDGTSLYVAYNSLLGGIYPQYMIQFNLPTPWTLPSNFTSSYIFDLSLGTSVVNDSLSINKIIFNESGNKLFVDAYDYVDLETKILIYNLTIPWDIRSCILEKEQNITSLNSSIQIIRENRRKLNLYGLDSSEQPNLNVQLFDYVGITQSPLLSQSIWPLDGADIYSTASIGLDSKLGVLQNNNTIITSPYENILNLYPAPLLSHKLLSYSYYSTINPLLPEYSKNNIFYSASTEQSFVSTDSTLDDILASDRVLQDTQIIYNNTPWTTADLRGKGPFYNSYDESSITSKLKTQEYSILPEFIISDKIIEYQTKFNSNVNFIDNDYLSLTGSSNSSSLQDDFFEKYVYTNNAESILTFNNKVKNNSLYTGNKTKRSLKLTFEGLLKFTPYDGFYPVQRTLDIVSAFNNSYKDGLSYFSFASSGSQTPSSGSEEYENPVLFEESKQNGLRSFITPLFAPGLLYNTIKAGVAVDYPILTGTMQSNEYYFVSGSSTRNRDRKTSLITNDNFDLRLPFETLIEPENYIKNINIIDQIPSSSYNNLNLNVTSSWNGTGDTNYKYMINNFLAEIPNFFLRDQKLSTLKSVPIAGQSIIIGPNEVNKEFRAIVKIKKSVNEQQKVTTSILNVVEDSTSKQNAINLQSIEYQYDRPQKFGEETITVYSNPSAFGPPCASGFISASSGESDNYTFNLVDSTNGFYAPYTPPYQDGEAWMLLTYKPTSTGKFTLDDVISNTSASFLRYELDQYEGVAIQNGFYNINGVESQAIGPMALYSSSAGIVDRLNNNAMQLSASIFLSVDNISVGERAGRQVEGGNQVSVADKKQLVISTKFETPILDFDYNRMITELSATHLQVMGAFESHPSGAVSSSTAIPKDLGMWHQYGLIPRDNAGIYLEITDIPKNYKQYGREVGLVLTGSEYKPNRNTETTGSFVQLIGGFQDNKVKLGTLAETKEIKEAVVAIPFTVDNKNKKYFKINNNVINNYKSNKTENISNSLLNQFNLMKEYVFPPQFDFLNYPSVDPVSMYIFEFTHKLSKTDLQDIWQNVMPELAESNKWKIETKSIKHELKENEIITPYNFDNSQEVRWLLFKVKKRADTNYYEMIGKNFVNKEEWSDTSIPKITYNWPYDFFTIIESGKMIAELEIEGDV